MRSRHRRAVIDRDAVPASELQLRRRREALLRDNLGFIIARRCADGAVTVLVYAGAGLAALLLPVLGYGGSARSSAHSGLGGIVFLAGLVVGALLVESALITGELPRLLPGARP
jgi:hypothetical protein